MKVYKTTKRFGGEKGKWTPAPDLKLEVEVGIDGLSRLKVNHTDDDVISFDIKFFNGGKTFEGAVQERATSKVGRVDYHGELQV